jgi:4-amino-4-deoxy-L-arabinose transferase-like glycosyltransferase
MGGRITIGEAPTNFQWRWRTALWIFLLAIAFRGLYLVEVTRHDGSSLLYMDEEYNYQWGKCLATGEWASPFDRLRTEPYFRAPLYSHFLAGLMALFGESLFLIRAVQMLLGAFSCALAYGVGTKCFGSRVGALTGILCAVNWVLTYFDGKILLPVLLVFLLLLGFLLLHRASEKESVGWAGIAGLVFGLFAITRPNILVFFPFIVGWAWLDRRGQPRRHAWMFTGALLCSLLLPPALVTIRNGVVGHDWVIVASQGGVNFYIGNNPESNGIDAVVPGTRATWWGGYEDTHRIAEEAEGRRLRPSGVSRYWTLRALRYIRSEPGHWLRLMGCKTIAWLGDPEVPNDEAYELRRNEYRSLSIPESFGLLLSLFLVSLPWQRVTPARYRPVDPQSERRRLLLVRLIWQFLAVYTLTFLLFFVTGRYRVPLIPFVTIGAALALVGIVDLIRERRYRRVAVLTTAAVALAVVLKIDYLGIREGSRWFALYNAAVEKVDVGKLDEGIAGFEALLAEGGVYEPEVYGTVIRAYERRGGPSDGRKMTLLAEQALLSYPQNLDLLGYAMRGHAAQGEWAAALSRAVEYTRAAPGEIPGWFEAFRAAQALGRRSDAQQFFAEADRRDPNHRLVALMRRELNRTAGGPP